MLGPVHETSRGTPSPWSACQAPGAGVAYAPDWGVPLLDRGSAESCGWPVCRKVREMAPSPAADRAVGTWSTARIVASIAALVFVFAIGRLSFFRVDNAEYAIV